MEQCKECGKDFKCVMVHASIKHDLYQYLIKHYNIDIAQKYAEGNSANQICAYIKEETGFIFRKLAIYKILDKLNIKRRSTSESGSLYLKSVGGVWNKGLTKEEHPSIDKYAKSRMGKDNPYFKASEEAKMRINYATHKSEEELKEIRKRSGEKLSSRISSGDLIHWMKKLSPEQLADVVKKSRMTYVKNIKTQKAVGFISRQERELGIMLADNNIKYKKQFRIIDEDKARSYDYLLTDYNIVIEFNGTYWHADPTKYEANYYNKSKKMTAKQIWDYDQYKKELAESHGYEVLYLWEDKFKKLDNEQFKKESYEIIKNYIDNKDKNG